ncbi:apolipoprotein N-acyltransferase [Sphingomonas vulcanisoli]|uniref:Apolipoprotein N-acyltransferase n=1 Tax=Sphingomonas vulcanisoli TaxID=1658060 RepID=A0ABX0TRP9_9SPHN|nr:apolipoprotein N-acyltransferase [Sphingomonas vulcanisoli]NIJ08192.1 apolipoprotein N-acyltransferase [Sphingomonas vulcanisoli]
MPLTLRRTCPIAFVLGALAACGFAPLELWPLTIACLIALIAMLERAGSTWRAAAIGWCFGVGHFCIGLNWIATAFTYQAAMPAWLGWLAVVLLSLYLAVFVAFSASCAYWLARLASPTPRAFVALFGAVWIIGELLRATLFTGFAWNPLAAIWVPLRIVPVMTLPTIGTYGLSGLTILIAGGLLHGAGFLRRAFGNATPAQRGNRAILLGAIALAVAIGCASIFIPIGMAPLAAANGPRIRVVQPNINQAEKWAPDAEINNFRRLVHLSGTPGPEPRLILWPEVAIPWFLEDDPDARTALAHVLGPRDLMLTGGEAVRYDAQGTMIAATNSLFGIDARGRLLGRYDKSHLVPYGEYLPMRPLLSRIGLSRLAPGDMDFDSGRGPADIKLPGIGLVGGQICYEIIFSGHVIDAAHRPRFLFNPSNDAWFGAWGPPQHLAQARLRAIEEAMPILRSTPTGISAVIDAQGRLLASLPWRLAGAIDARLPAVGPPTLFSRYGNLLPLAFALFLVAIGFASRLRRR